MANKGLLEAKVPCDEPAYVYSISLIGHCDVKFLVSPKRKKALFEITTVKEEMSHAFNVLFADKAKCSIRIAEPWYATAKTELANKSNLNVQSTKSGNWSARDQK